MTSYLRLPSIGILSLITTVTLFSIMANLVGNEGATLLPSRNIIIIPTIEDIITEPTREVERIIKPEIIIEPDLPKIAPIPSGPSIFTIPRKPITLTNDGDMLELNLGADSEGDFLPLVVVQPTYPRRAAEAGIEGYAIIQLTVTATGGVKDASIIESSSTLFNRSAVNAALKFKYKPRVKNGVAVEVIGVRYQFTFTLDN